MTDESKPKIVDNDKPKITSEKKSKDPKRVEAGKKLAQISKEAKEKKMRQRIESERLEENSNGNNTSYVIVFSVVGTVIAVASLYYQYQSSKVDKKLLADATEEKHDHVVVEKKDRPFKLDSLE